MGCTRPRKAVAFFEQQTGVTPVYGGEHTGGITANFLVAIRSCTYLEIVVPKSRAASAKLAEKAGRYAHMNIAGFAFGLADASLAQGIFQNIDLQTGALREGSRSRSDRV